MPEIYPSLMAADQLNLQKEMEKIDSHVDGYHIDIMDNHFVPNSTLSALTTNAIAKFTKQRLWIHLMVDNPLNWLDILDLPEHTILTFQLESISDKEKIINRIHEKKWVPSITIKPKTAIAETFPLLNVINHVQLMSVEPGFSGQRFLDETWEKIDTLIEFRTKNKLNFTLAIDGGVNTNNIKQLTQKGVEHLVVGSGIFSSPNPLTALLELKKLVGK